MPFSWDGIVSYESGAAAFRKAVQLWASERGNSSADSSARLMSSNVFTPCSLPRLNVRRADVSSGFASAMKIRQ